MITYTYCIVLYVLVLSTVQAAAVSKENKTISDKIIFIISGVAVILVLVLGFWCYKRKLAKKMARLFIDDDHEL